MNEPQTTEGKPAEAKPAEGSPTEGSSAGSGWWSGTKEFLFGTKKESDPNEEKLLKYRVQVFQNVQKIGLLSVVFLGLGLLLAVLMGGWRGTVEGVAIVGMAALACYVGGSLVGFIFSIPRSAQGDPQRPAVPSSRVDDLPRDNTNLEQISDWFVKILIGAGITQLAELKAVLLALSAKLSSSLVVAKASVSVIPQSPVSVTMISSTNDVGVTNFVTMSANAVPSPANLASPYFHGFGQEFCLFLILYFLALGFLTGYLITRVWLPYVLRTSAVALSYMDLKSAAQAEAAREFAGKAEQVKQEAKAEAKQEVKQEVTEEVTQEIGEQKKLAFREALTGLGLLDGNNPPHVAGSSELVASDPHKGQFGGKAEADGLKLSAEVKPFAGIDDEYFRVQLKVVRTDGGALTAPATFYLHPTFTPDVVIQPPVNNEAVLERAAWGAFTVGVLAKNDAGQETKLELDLADLPDAPALFKSR